VGKQPIRDERQNDLFGLPAAPVETPRRVRPGLAAEATEDGVEVATGPKAPRARRKRAAQPEDEPTEAGAEASAEIAAPPPLPPPEPESPAALAERAGRADLDEFVSALSDEGLAHLALASARALKRRLARDKGRRGPGPAGKGGAGPLEKAVQSLSAEVAGSSGEDTW